MPRFGDALIRDSCEWCGHPRPHDPDHPEERYCARCRKLIATVRLGRATAAAQRAREAERLARAKARRKATLAREAARYAANRAARQDPRWHDPRRQEPIPNTPVEAA